MKKKISLTAKELRQMWMPMFDCFGGYNQESCWIKGLPRCSHFSLRTCRKVTLFLEKG